MDPAFDSIRRAQPLLGTFVEISVLSANRSDTDAAVEAAFHAVAKVHRLMSFHDRDSDVSRLNREASTRAVAVDAWTFQVLELALDLHHRSIGMFDIAVAPLLQNMGLLPRLQDDRLSVSMKTSDAIELLPGHNVRFQHRGVRIDLGGIAKGFAVDRAVDILRDYGVPSGLVNAGGDLAAFGLYPHMVYIRDPRDPRRLMCRIEVSNEALATSGDCFNPFRSSDTIGSAVIDPWTRKPSRAIHGATVRAPSCMVADALTKVVILAGESATTLLEHYRASALSVSLNGDVMITRDWQDTVHLAA